LTQAEIDAFRAQHPVAERSGRTPPLWGSASRPDGGAVGPSGLGDRGEPTDDEEDDSDESDLDEDETTATALALGAALHL
jgi:hypothetical protein